MYRRWCEDLGVTTHWRREGYVYFPLPDHGNTGFRCLSASCHLTHDIGPKVVPRLGEPMGLGSSLSMKCPT